jgi:putative ABC transport system permease protein
MFRLGIKNALAHKRRLFSTGLAVLIGVAFLAGTLIFTSTISRTFDDLFANVYEKTDAVVRSSESIDVGFGTQIRGRIPDDLVDVVATVDGVAEAIGETEGTARIIGKDGTPMGRANGSPNFGMSVTPAELSPWEIAAGRLPSGPDEMAMDNGSFKRGNFAEGDRVTVVSQAGSREFTVVGAVRFGATDSPGGATFALFDLPTAQSFVGRPGEIDSISVGGDGSISEQALTERIQQALPEGANAETLTGAEITEESQTALQDALSFFNILLLVFAGVGLFVASFIIYNTFAITVTQRLRENALLRAVGASRTQVLGSLLVEAVIIGFIASVVGLIAGIGVSQGLRAAMDVLGFDIPASGLVITSRTIVIALVVGTLITAVAAVFPAIRASRVPPVAAMRDVSVDRSAVAPARIVVGLVVTGLGVASLLAALTGAGPIWFLGAAVLFIGLFILGPVIARPLAHVLGAPLPAARGITGELARENAVRNPKRTARTAAALLVGVALVSGVTVIAASVKSSVRSIFDEQFTGDFVLAAEGGFVGGLPITVAPEISALAEVEEAAGIGLGFGRVDGTDRLVTLVDPVPASRLFDLDMVAGEVTALTDEGVLLSSRQAERESKALGDTVSVYLLDGQERLLTVQGIYDNDELAGAVTVTKSLYGTSGGDQFDFSVFIIQSDDVTAAEAETAIAVVADRYQNATLQSRADYIDTQAAQIDQFVNLVYALLALSILIAVIGIANTLSLSVFERTRELGLLRAVGASRAQVRSSVRWESIITAVLGTAQGILVGILLGYAVIVALRDEGLRTFTLPWTLLVFILLGAILAGVIAAWLPARRAARLNVLRAIAYE